MKALCTNGVKAVIVELVPAAERALGMPVDTDYASTKALMDKIAAGATGDLAVLSAEAIDELIGKGVLQHGSRTDLARSVIGVAVRSGAPEPDIGSADALKAALLAAKAVVYSRTGISGMYMPELFAKLGIADAVAPKAVIPTVGSVGEALARGDGDIGLQQVSELLPIAGIKVVGPLPDSVQLVTVFSAGIFSSAKEPQAARALVSHLTADATRSLYSAKGLQPAF
jgi:molybdate transport system substrate-binding protein